jgi:tetratricopeptide (TPR) repeat protein
VLTVPSISRFGVRHLVLLATLVWPAAASAEPAAQGAADPLARTRFEQGVAAFDDGRFREAVELFKEADRLAPSPLHSFNVAKVYERMGDDRNALARYREYLRRLPTAENAAEVRRRVADLERSLKELGVQQLSVLTTPPGATVLIDDVARGASPWTGELPPGRHLLALRLSGYRDKVKELELPADHAIDVELTLQRSAPAQVAPAETTPASAVSAPAAAAVSQKSREEALPVAEEPLPVPRWWTWAMFGGAAAAFVGAGAFEVSRGNLEDAARDSDVQTVSLAKYDEMERHQAFARVFLGAGVVAALAGGVSLYFDVRRADEAPTDMALGCSGDGCSLVARGHF